LEPVTDAWKKQSEEEIKKLLGEKPKTRPGFFDAITSALYAIFTAITSPVPTEPAAPVREERPENNLSRLTPNQRDVLKAIEEKSAKLGFKTTLRFMSIDNRERFSPINTSLVMGSLSQLSTQNLNGFKIDKYTKTKGKWIFKKYKGLLRKKRLYWLYWTRTFGFQTIVMNTEELATLYHYPTKLVEAPRLQRIEAKKAEPPANLPIA
jgi:hypothetical protein